MESTICSNYLLKDDYVYTQIIAMIIVGAHTPPKAELRLTKFTDCPTILTPPQGTSLLGHNLNCPT